MKKLTRMKKRKKREKAENKSKEGKITRKGGRGDKIEAMKMAKDETLKMDKIDKKKFRRKKGTEKENDKEKGKRGRKKKMEEKIEVGKKKRGRKKKIEKEITAKELKVKKVGRKRRRTEENEEKKKELQMKGKGKTGGRGRRGRRKEGGVEEKIVEKESLKRRGRKKAKIEQAKTEQEKIEPAKAKKRGRRKKVEVEKEETFPKKRGRKRTIEKEKSLKEAKEVKKKRKAKVRKVEAKAEAEAKVEVEVEQEAPLKGRRKRRGKRPAEKLIEIETEIREKTKAKKGRRPKVKIEEIKESEPQIPPATSFAPEEEKTEITVKRRGRKKKEKIEKLEIITEPTPPTLQVEAPRKRGRKPKLMEKPTEPIEQPVITPIKIPVKQKGFESKELAKKESKTVTEITEEAIKESVKIIKGTNIIDIGSNLELFVDEFLIDKMKNLSLQLQKPVQKEIDVYFDAPWEGELSGCVTIFRDDNLFRMYYRGSGKDKPEVTCYADSRDGIRWLKPELRIFEFRKLKDNNIIHAGVESHNFAPFKDTNPFADEDEKYKAIAGNPLLPLVSPDGFQWQIKSEKPIVSDSIQDSFNVSFWDPIKKRYVAYIGDLKKGVRGIKCCFSKDFVNWTSPKWLEIEGDSEQEHIYVNAIFPYFRAPHIILGFFMRLVPERKSLNDPKSAGVSDVIFLCSRDLISWKKFPQRFISPDLDHRNWTGPNLMPVNGIIRTGKNELSIFYNELYGYEGNRLRRATLELDRFVSISASPQGGEFVTKPLLFKGNNLLLNFSTSAIGSVRVEILDDKEKPIIDFKLKDCEEIYGNELEHVVKWKNSQDLIKLAGTPIRLKFVLKDANLFSIRFK